MTFVYDFSWVIHWQLSQEKLKTMIMQSFEGGAGGRGGGQGKRGALWGMCKWRILSFQLTRLYELYELVIVVIDFFLLAWP